MAASIPKLEGFATGQRLRFRLRELARLFQLAASRNRKDLQQVRMARACCENEAGQLSLVLTSVKIHSVCFLFVFMYIVLPSVTINP